MGGDNWSSSIPTGKIVAWQFIGQQFHAKDHGHVNKKQKTAGTRIYRAKWKLDVFGKFFD